MGKKSPVADPEARSKLRQLAEQLRRFHAPRLPTLESDRRGVAGLDIDGLARDALNADALKRGLAGDALAQLSLVQFPNANISPDLAAFAVRTIDRFLSGEEKSLDAAFGLPQKPGSSGHKPDVKRQAAIARAIVPELKRLIGERKKSDQRTELKKQIAKGNHASVRTLERVLELVSALTGRGDAGDYQADRAAVIEGICAAIAIDPQGFLASLDADDKRQRLSLRAVQKRLANDERKKQDKKAKRKRR